MYRNIIVLLIIICVTQGEDYYEILGIKKTADQREIRKAFKKLAVTHHPDKNSDDPKAHEKFVKLTTAYEVLKDPDLRKKYDLYGEEGLDNSNSQRRSYHSWNYYQNNFGIYDDDPEVTTLDRHEYYESVIDSDKVWIVNFYSPMCSHCHQLAPTWRRIAKELEGAVRVGAVNCEDEWRLCHQIGIQSYPTLLHFPKNSKQGTRYTGKKTYDEIIQFVFDRLEANIQEIPLSIWKRLLHGNGTIEKPILIFTCGGQSNCFSPEKRLKIAATLDKMVNVMTFSCKLEKCDDLITSDTSAVYLPTRNTDSWVPVVFQDIEDANLLIEKVLEQLPEPQDLTAEDFEDIQKLLEEGSNNGWLICFYMGHATELDLTLKRLPGIIDTVQLGKINCGRHSRFCSQLNINRYPMWGVLKPGGAFEPYHGKNTIHGIAKFAENSIKASNVWALTAEKVLSILQRTDDKAWFLDWYAPWCPPCMQFLPEVRRASMEFDKSVVRFGTVDCTVHSSICRQYNIRSYPTAMLINGSNTIQFTVQKTAANIVQFINEARNPSVIQITSKNFNFQLGKKGDKVMWVVDYFAPWCGPCQQLAPEWTTVAKTLKNVAFVKVASVNCEEERALCKSQGIQSYPNIRLYPLGTDGLNTVALYNGQRDSVSLLKWITSFFPKKIRDFDPSSLRKELSNGKHVWIIDFFASWCGHCQVLDPQFAIAAQLLDKTARFGRLNCETYSTHCSQYGVRGYPTIMAYDTKHDRKSIGDGFRIEGRTAETIKNDVLQFVSSRRKYRDEL